MLNKKKSLFSFGLIFIICINIFLINTNKVYANDIIAKGAILYNMNTKEVLYQKDADKKLPMASTTKIMTGLLLFSSGKDLDEEFVVDSEAIKVEGSSMGLVEGDIVTLRTLGYGLLLKSGNDAAGAIAKRIAGSIENFVKMMNDKAREIGLKNTHFVTPSGLDADEHYSTAYDMAVLASYALENEDFKKACSSERAKLRYGNPPYDRTLTNSNKLLKQYEGAIGVKTGFTKKSGRCLVSAANRGSDTLIVVTLNAADDWNVHKNLFDYGFSLEKEKILKQNQYDLYIPVENGQKDLVLTGIIEEINFKYIVKNYDIEERIVIDKILQAPVSKNQILGYIKYYYKDVLLKEIPIYAKDDVYIKPEPKLNFFDKIKRFFNIFKK